MAKQMNEIKEHTRLWVQILFTAVTNGYFYGFTTGRIYTGRSKTVCVPGLNVIPAPAPSALARSVPYRQCLQTETIGFLSM